MKNKTIFITGGTGGIGKQTAVLLAQTGATVIVSGRNKNSAAAAVEEIKRISGNSAVEYVTGNLENTGDLKHIAEELNTKYRVIDVLINNAGSAAPQRELNGSGIELNFAVNVLAPYMLSGLLLPMLKQSEDPRIVTLTGGSVPATADLENIQNEKNITGLTAYSESKLFMMTLMYEYAQQLKQHNISCNICYPGQASTAMTQGVTREMLPGIMKWFFPLFRYFVKPDDGTSARRASASGVYLAVSDEVKGKTGLYVDKKCRPAELPAFVTNINNRNFILNYVQTIINKVG